MSFPEEPYIGEICVYKLLAEPKAKWAWHHDYEIAFVWDGIVWERDDEVTKQIRGN